MLSHIFEHVQGTSSHHDHHWGERFKEHVDHIVDKVVSWGDEMHQHFHPLPKDTTKQFAAGFLYGASNGTIDQRDYILDCAWNCWWVSRSLNKAFEDYNAGDIQEGNKHMMKAEPFWRLSMLKCHETNADFRALAHAQNSFMA